MRVPRQPDGAQELARGSRQHACASPNPGRPLLGPQPGCGYLHRNLLVGASFAARTRSTKSHAGSRVCNTADRGRPHVCESAFMPGGVRVGPVAARCCYPPSCPW